MNDKSLEKDEILILTRELFEKWKKVRVRRFIVDKEIIFSPVYMGINLKKIRNLSIISENGGLVNDLKKPNEYANIGFCVTIGVGDFNHPKANGLGIGHYTDRTSLKSNALKKNINKAIDGAFKMALSEYFQHHSQISEYKKDKEFQKLSKGKSTNYSEAEKRLICDFKKIAGVIEEADNLISKNKKIKHSELEFSITEENCWFASFEKRMDGQESENQIFTSEIYGFISWMITVKDIKGRDIKFYETRKLTDGFNCKKETDDLQKIMGNLAEKFHQAPELESGLYRAVLSPETTYTIFHEGFGAHLASARLIDEKGATAFKAKLGQKILPDNIDIIDDPTMENYFGSYKFDDDGQPAKKVVLIENGILKSYLHDRISAGRDNIISNGHSRAEFGEIPEARTANMIVSSKKSVSSDKLIKMIIEDLKYHKEPFGLYINGRSGEVEVESGQFKIYVSEFYKIYPDGKIEPVSSAFISGSAYETLNQVKAVGNNLTECVGHCGSNSGYVRVSGLCPSVYFRKIQVLSSAEDPNADNLMKEDED
ncbi:MAG: TldD/PmbA family protein [Candidatus Niyogibacteria bacterium]|nr:TldD/PmbA family protein [Candidatus Niyogibacteria bacterium]